MDSKKDFLMVVDLVKTSFTEPTNLFYCVTFILEKICSQDFSVVASYDIH